MPSNKIGALSVDLSLETQNFLNGLKDAQKETDALTKAFKPLTTSLLEFGETLSVVGDAVAGTMIAMTLKTAEYGAELVHLHEKSGVSVEDLSKLGYAADQNGSSMEALGNGLKFLSKNMELATTGSKAQRDAFSALGISEDEIRATGGKASEAFILLADKISGMADPSQHAADLTKILGKNWTELLPTLELGSAGLHKAGDEAERLGKVISEEAAEADLKFEQTLKQVKTAAEGVGIAIGDALMPVLQPMLESIRDHIVDVKDFANEHETLTRAIFDVSVAIGGAGGLLLALAGIGTIYPKVTAGFELMSQAGEALGLSIGALGGATGLFALAGVAAAAGIIIYDQYKASTKDLDDSIKHMQGTMDGTITSSKLLADIQDRNAKGFVVGADEMQMALALMTKEGKNAEAQQLAQSASTIKLSGDLKNVVVDISATGDATIKAADSAKTSGGVWSETIDKTSKVEAAWRAAQSELYAKAVGDAAKFVDAWVKGFQVTSDEADKYTNAVQRSEVATSKLAYSTLDATVVINGAVGTTGDAWEAANAKAMGSNAKLFNEINGLRETDVDAAVISSEQIVKADQKRVDSQIKEADRYHDAFVASIANLNTRIAESFADMVVHAKFNMDSLVNIAQDTAGKMLSAFLSGLLSPLTNKLASLGGQLASAIGLGGTAPAGGAIDVAALGKAGFTADAAGGGALSAIGGVLTSPITLGIGAAIAGTIALIKSQAHWEANDLVQNIQNPFDAEWAKDINAVMANQDSMSSGDIHSVRDQLHDLWANTTDTVQSWAAGSSDRGTVASQFFETEIPSVIHWLDWLDSLVAGKQAVGLAVGMPYVPYDNFPALLHRGEAVIPAAQNPNAGGSGMGWGVHIENLNISGASGDVRQMVRDFLQELQRMIPGNQGNVKTILRSAMGAAL